MTWIPGAWDYCWAWVFSNGVPGNLVASGIAFTVGYFVGLRKHMKKLVEIHHHLDPTHPFTLGDDNGNR